jgi:hypothetical protein
MDEIEGYVYFHDKKLVVVCPLNFHESTGHVQSPVHTNLIHMICPVHTKFRIYLLLY